MYECVGGWNSEAVVQEYIDDSTVTKSTIAEAISGESPQKKQRTTNDIDAIVKVDLSHSPDDTVKSTPSVHQSFHTSSIQSSESIVKSVGNVYNFHFH